MFGKIIQQDLARPADRLPRRRHGQNGGHEKSRQSGGPYV
jgi:hypothetical protein